MGGEGGSDQGWGRGIGLGDVGLGGVRVDVNREVNFFVKNKKYIHVFFFLGGVEQGGGSDQGLGWRRG